MKDVSEKMEERRRLKQITPKRPDSLDDSDIEEWVRDRFSLDYKSE